MSHTYVVMEVSQTVYREIREKLLAAGYDQSVQREDGRVILDMHGIALAEDARSNWSQATGPKPEVF